MRERERIFKFFVSPETKYCNHKVCFQMNSREESMPGIPAVCAADLSVSFHCSPNRFECHGINFKHSLYELKSLYDFVQRLSFMFGAHDVSLKFRNRFVRS